MISYLYIVSYQTENIYFRIYGTKKQQALVMAWYNAN